MAAASWMAAVVCIARKPAEGCSLKLVLVEKRNVLAIFNENLFAVLVEDLPEFRFLLGTSSLNKNLTRTTTNKL